MDEFKKSRNNKTLMVIIALVVIVVIVIAVYAIVSKNISDKTDQKPENTNQENAQAGDGFPTVFYSYSGLIETIGDNSIVIKASQDKNYLKQDKTITVRIDNETEFVSIKFPTKAADIETNNGGKLFQRDAISIQDLKPGDEITAISYENVKNQDSFLAKKVEKMN